MPCCDAGPPAWRTVGLSLLLLSPPSWVFCESSRNRLQIPSSLSPSTCLFHQEVSLTLPCLCATGHSKPKQCSGGSRTKDWGARYMALSCRLCLVERHILSASTSDCAARSRAIVQKSCSPLSPCRMLGDSGSPSALPLALKASLQ